MSDLSTPQACPVCNKDFWGECKCGDTTYVYRIRELEQRYGVLKPPSEQGWQPIETAPREDFAQFLVGRSKSAGVEAVLAAMRVNDIIMNQSCTDVIHEPTHWMPLPEPPND